MKIKGAIWSSSSLIKCHYPVKPGNDVRRRGQSTLEYAMIIAVAAAALAAMSLYVQRSVQANLKTIEDQINAEVAVEKKAVNGVGAGNIIDGPGVMVDVGAY